MASTRYDNIDTNAPNFIHGVYTPTAPSYSGTQPAALRFTSDGKVMVDTEMTLDGNVVVDNVAVWATNISDSSTSGFGLTDSQGHPQVDVLSLTSGTTASSLGKEESRAHVSGDVGVMALAVRQDTGTAMAADGQYTALQTDSLGNVRQTQATQMAGEDLSNNILATTNKPLAVSDYSPSNYKNLGTSDSANIKATAGNIFTIGCINTSGTDAYFQIHNTTAVPAAAAVPEDVVIIPTGQQTIAGTDYFTVGGLHLNTGVTFVISTVQNTYGTTGGIDAGEFSTIVRYI